MKFIIWICLFPHWIFADFQTFNPFQFSPIFGRQLYSFNAPFSEYAVNRLSVDNPMMRPVNQFGVNPYAQRPPPMPPPMSFYAPNTVPPYPRPPVVPMSMLKGCFYLFPNCIIINAVPFERRVSVNPSTCANFCMETAIMSNGKYMCRSFLYDTVKGICDLFDTTGRELPAKLIRYKLFDYYEVKPHCINGGRLPPPTGGGYVEPTSGPLPSTSIRTSTSGGSTFEPPSTTDEPIEQIVCPIGTSPIFQRIEGQTLDSGKTLVITEVPNDEDCISFCVANRGPNGPFECRAAVYNFDSHSCILSNDEAQPAGELSLIQDVGSTYFEKTCVPEDLGAHCSPFVMLERFPQMIIVGFNEKMTTVGDFQLCIELCLDSTRNFGFVCRSIMFYSERKQDNCMLNTVHHDQEDIFGSLFVAEEFEQVDYISFEPCTRDEIDPDRTNRQKTTRKISKQQKFSLKKSMKEKNFKPLRRMEPKQAGDKAKRNIKDPFRKYRKQLQRRKQTKNI